MPTPDTFQLGILPERKLDRRALAASYGLLVLLIIVMINIGLIWPDSMSVAADGFVYFTANQLNRQPRFHEGKDLRNPPYLLLRVPLGAGSPLWRCRSSHAHSKYRLASPPRFSLRSYLAAWPPQA